MHDSKTQAFELYGMRGLYRRWRRDQAFDRKDENWIQIDYPDPIVRVWHVDPEADGSDDSCGYSYARLTSKEREKAIEVAGDMIGAYSGMFESEFEGGYIYERGNVETVIGAFEVVAWRVFRKRIKPRHLPRILSAACNPTDNLLSLLNVPMGKNDIERFICIVARNFKTYDRRWWQHPRWHVHHWQFQFPWLQDLKRILFKVG